MKKILIYSGLIYLVLTIAVIGAYHYLLSSKDNTVRIEHIDATNGKRAMLTMDDEGHIMPLDFTKTSEKVVEAVVHIKSTQAFSPRERYKGRREFNRQLPDPFKDFFGDREDDLFGPFFRYGIPRDQNGPQFRIGTGSGVILSEKGYIVTNNHVVADADDLEVTLHDNRVFKAVVVGTDPATDLALVHIKAENLPTLPLINSDDIKVGEWVLAVGNPLGLNSTVTAGIVSAKGRSINILKEQFAVESFIQTDAAINPGNSGGALVNLEGGLVGINTAIASPTGSYAGYGFAIPANIVNKVVEDLLTYGTVQRGILGVMIRSVDGNWAKEKDLDINTGAYIDTLLENSAAAKAGLTPGDVIIEVDGTVVNSSPDLQAKIAQHHPGDIVNIKVNRKGIEKTFEVTLDTQFGDTKLVKNEYREILGILGIDVAEIDKKLADKLNIKGGVIVTDLKPGKILKQTYMDTGFIITHIDGQEIDDVDSFVKTLSKKKGGVMVEGVYENIPGTYYYAFGMDS